MPGKQDQTPGKIDGPFHAAGGAESEGEGKKASPFRLLPASYPISDEQVTATLLVPFMQDGRVLVIEHAERGIDIPGGHKELSDRTNFETARRELFEESGAMIGHIAPCLVLKNDQYKTEAGDPTYMVVMTGVVQELGRFTPSNEVVARHLLSPEVFLECYGGDHAEDMAFILQAAQQTINHERGEAPEFHTGH